MDKRLFAAKDERDIKDIGADTAVFLWNCFQRELHGVWVSTKQGNLEPYAFGGKFRCQVECNPNPCGLLDFCIVQYTCIGRQTIGVLNLILLCFTVVASVHISIARMLACEQPVTSPLDIDGSCTSRPCPDVSPVSAQM